MATYEVAYDNTREICVRLTILEAEALLKFLKPKQNNMSAKQENAYLKIAAEYHWAATGRQGVAVKTDADFAKSLTDHPGE